MSSLNDIIGQVGLGGESGFQIQQNNNVQPYEAITRVLVTDETTQEVKLLIATARGDSASSTLGTMALDVFPLQGRPHLKDLVIPVFNLTEAINTNIPPVSITNSNTIPAISAGVPMPEYSLTAVGGVTPYSWYSNNLPIGLTLDISGVLRGTAMVLGNYEINISVVDSSSPAFIATQVFNLTVGTSMVLSQTSAVVPGLGVTPPSSPIVLPPATIGSFYTQNILATGGVPPYTWAIDTDTNAGKPPIGLSITSNGTLEGYPVTYSSSVAEFSTPYIFTLIVSDSLGASITGKYSILLAPMPLTIGHSDTQNVYAAKPTSILVPVYGGQAPYSLIDVTTDMVQTPIPQSPLTISISV